MTRKTLPDNSQLRYDYDHNGNLTTYTDAGGQVTYTYDQVNLLTELLEPGASTPVRFGHDNDNRRTSTTYPTSPATVMTIGYDNAGRQTSVKATAGTTTLSSFTYSCQKNGADTDRRYSDIHNLSCKRAFRNSPKDKRDLTMEMPSSDRLRRFRIWRVGVILLIAVFGVIGFFLISNRAALITALVGAAVLGLGGTYLAEWSYRGKIPAGRAWLIQLVVALVLGIAAYLVGRVARG